MIDALHRIVYEGGHLIGVREALLWEDGGPVSALELSFDSLTATFSVDSEFDSINATLTTMPDGLAISPSTQAIWQSCLGKGLHWAWQLKNQQGYVDGVRLEFHNPGEEGTERVELIAMASGLEFFLANRFEA